MEDKIIVLCGKSASGKDTLAKMISDKYGYNFIVSTTTRPIRDGESQENPYHFVSKEDFEQLINEGKLIEYRTYNTLVDGIPAVWYYGAEKREVQENKKYIAVLDIMGLDGFKETFGDRVVSFYLHASDEVRKSRCINRGDFNESEFNRRLVDDEIVFSDEVIKNKIDFKLSGEMQLDVNMNLIEYLTRMIDIKFEI